jgi:CheY-like chemotaxis protein
MVVIVDDDSSFRSGLAEHLRDDGHTVAEYDSPAALPPLESLAPPSLLITDYQMPGEDGLRLAKRLHAVHPNVPVIIVTAYWTEHLDAEANGLGFVTVHRKPCDYFDFHDLVHRLAGSETQR